MTRPRTTERVRAASVRLCVWSCAFPRSGLDCTILLQSCNRENDNDSDNGDENDNGNENDEENKK